jgi:predicted O-methyltransferase YrrM
MFAETSNPQSHHAAGKGCTASIDAVLAVADRLLPEFRAAIDVMPPHERGPGLFLSEMFFFYCVVRPMNPSRILESGRDLAGSTLLLANCFPHARTISVEFNATSPHAKLALEKLEPHRNVECLFGDSRELLPKLIEPGDPVLIDGPKEFRALKLALHLLHTNKPSVVFLHDFGAGLPWRGFLEKHWPSAFFSDHPEFLRRFGSLDNVGQASRPTTFACLPAKLPASYYTLLGKIVLSRTASLAPVKINSLSRKLFRR